MHLIHAHLCAFRSGATLPRMTSNLLDVATVLLLFIFSVGPVQLLRNKKKN